MSKPPEPKPSGLSPAESPQAEIDPALYASSLNGLMMDRNPLQTIWGDLTRMVMVIVNLGKTRKMAQQRLDQIHLQITKIEEDIASVHTPTEGTRFNKLR